MSTREFHLGDILSITTGRLVSPRHMDGIYDILNFLTGDNLFTHQLPRAAGECQGPLLAQHPALADVEDLDKFGDEDGALEVKDAVDRWLAAQIAIYGETLPVTALAAEDHTYIDPITELQAKVSAGTEIIVVEVPATEEHA